MTDTNQKVFTREDPMSNDPLPITYSYAIFDGVVVVTGSFMRGKKEANVLPAAIPMEVLRWLAEELLPQAQEEFYKAGYDAGVEAQMGLEEQKQRLTPHHDREVRHWTPPGEVPR